MSAAELAGLKSELDALGILPIVSSGLDRSEIEPLLAIANVLDAPLIRFALTTVLCGDRAVADPPWAARVAAARDKLARFAPQAAAAGKTIVIENHQDFTSAELVALCDEFGPAVRIVYDTGNSFPVGEAPLDFTRTIAPYVRHIHLKDYRVQRADDGIRLVRCAIGDGAVPFPDLFAILAEHHDELPAVLEPGALDVRHVLFFTEGWWQLYPPREARAFAACIAATARNSLPPDADFRTPWERDDDGAVETYELDMIRRSAANMRRLGIMGGTGDGSGS